MVKFSLRHADVDRLSRMRTHGAFEPGTHRDGELDQASSLLVQRPRFVGRARQRLVLLLYVR